MRPVRVATLSVFIASAVLAAGCKPATNTNAPAAASPAATAPANDKAALDTAVDAFIQGA